VYSTCSILSEENEHVVDAFLKHARDASPLPLEQLLSRTAQRPPSPAASRPPSKTTLASRASPPASFVQRRGMGLAFFPSTDHQGGFLAHLRKSTRSRGGGVHKRLFCNTPRRSSPPRHFVYRPAVGFSRARRGGLGC
jgi:hypothetical protein